MNLIHSNRPVVSLPVLAVALLCFVGSCLQCRADDHHAAIAYSPSTGSYGYYYGHVSLGTAKSRALDRCRGKDARIVAWVRNGWACLALGKEKGVYGWGVGSSRAIARSAAMQGCRDRTTGCYVAVLVFSGR